MPDYKSSYFEIFNKVCGLFLKVYLNISKQIINQRKAEFSKLTFNNVSVSLKGGT